MSLKIADYKVEELLKMGNPKNPRWMPDQQMDALQSSLEEFGIVEPIIINLRTNQIVGGHQRVQAAEAKGIQSIPAVQIDVDSAQETALNLALNKIKGQWDYEKLATVLDDIQSAGAVDLLATGFTENEAAAIVSGFQVDEEEIADGEDNSGIVREIRNRTEEEVEEALESTHKVQFGMFAKAIPVAVYDQWVETLILRSKYGESPSALGTVVAELLGIEIKTDEMAEGDAIAEYEIDEVGEEVAEAPV